MAKTKFKRFAKQTFAVKWLLLCFHGLNHCFCPFLLDHLPHTPIMAGL